MLESATFGYKAEHAQDSEIHALRRQERRAALQALVSAASRAPSADNLQPWKFVIEEETGAIDLYLDTSRERFPFNAGQFLSLIPCGAALENMARLALGHGWKVNVTLFQHPKKDHGAAPLVARLSVDSLVGSRRQDDSSLRTIAARVTNRKFYDGRRIPGVLLENLRAATPEDSGLATHWITDRQHLDSLAQVMARADATLFSHPPFRQAMVSNVRFDLPANAEAQLGLPLGALELRAPDRIALRGMKFIPDAAFKLSGAKHLFAAHTRKLVQRSSGLCLVTAKDEGLHLALRTGRAMQRAWLGLTEHGLAAQPMMTLPMLENAARVNPEELDAAFGLTDIQAQLARFRGCLSAAGIHDRACFVLRFGFAPAPTARTGRLSDRVIE